MPTSPSPSWARRRSSGRGLGAYIALMLAGARPQQVRGAVLCDGPGLAGGAIVPTSQSFVTLAPSQHPPDPYALFELSYDLRPPDYATLFVRMAVESSGLDEPIAVAAVVRPPWLAAVVGELGVMATSVPEALAAYAPGRSAPAPCHTHLEQCVHRGDHHESADQPPSTVRARLRALDGRALGATRPRRRPRHSGGDRRAAG